MKGFILLFALFFLASCEKDNCNECQMITLDNYEAAQLKCDGLASDYPEGFVENQKSDWFENCGAVEAGTIENKSSLCDDVFQTIRFITVCR